MICRGESQGHKQDGEEMLLASLGSAQISVRASAGTRPRFLPLLTRMKPSTSLLRPTPTQICTETHTVLWGLRVPFMEKRAQT